MLHACVRKFDVMGTVQKFLGTKQGSCWRAVLFMLQCQNVQVTENSFFSPFWTNHWGGSEMWLFIRRLWLVTCIYCAYNYATCCGSDDSIASVWLKSHFQVLGGSSVFCYVFLFIEFWVSVFCCKVCCRSLQRLLMRTILACYLLYFLRKFIYNFDLVCNYLYLLEIL